jgi:hypothetical protein
MPSVSREHATLVVAMRIPLWIAIVNPIDLYIKKTVKARNASKIT